MESGVAIEHFDIHVDPTSASVVTVTRVAKSSSPGALSVAGDADLAGSGVWDASTGQVIANLRVSNHGTWSWDEPSLVVVAMATSASSLQVLEAAGQPATFDGTGGVGSSWALSDVEAAGGTASATRTIAIYDPEAKPATVSVDVVAFRTHANVVPDREGDGWNSEFGPAGGDCNDEDPTRHPAGDLDCDCASACPGGAGAPACGDGACCREEVTEPGARHCDTGCNCTVGFVASGDKKLSCGVGSVCRLASVDQTTTLDVCDSGAVCQVGCRRTTATAVSSCTIGICRGASCDILATGASRVEITSCEAGATCVVECGPGAECHLGCKDESSDCRITNCSAGTCVLDCPSGESTDCGNTKVCGGPERC